MIALCLPPIKKQSKSCYWHCYPPLPCFELHPHQFGRIRGSHATNRHQTSSDFDSAVPTPSHFHRPICNRIICAQDQLILASLCTLVLEAIINHPTQHHRNAKRMNCSMYWEKHPRIQMWRKCRYCWMPIELWEKCRTPDQRTTNGDPSAQSHSTSSVMSGSYFAKAVYSKIHSFFYQSLNERSGVFLFPVNNSRLCSFCLLPSLLAGVFHIKVRTFIFYPEPIFCIISNDADCSVTGIYYWRWAHFIWSQFERRVLYQSGRSVHEFCKWRWRTGRLLCWAMRHFVQMCYQIWQGYVISRVELAVVVWQWISSKAGVGSITDGTVQRR